MKQQRKVGNKRIANNLVALGSVAIISVYGVGYLRTQGAANAIASQEQKFASAPPPIATSIPTPVATIDAFLAATAVPTQPPLLVSSNTPVSPATSNAAVSSASTATLPSATAAALPPSPTAKPTVPPIATEAATATPTKPGLKDGTYVGNGNSRHGGIEATIVVTGGKIVSANITVCGTRYSCSRVDSLIKEVVATQAPPVDLVSGATDSSYAYVDAVTQALSQAT